MLDIDHLDFPEGRNDLQGRRGWDVYDGAGVHIGFPRRRILHGR